MNGHSAVEFMAGHGSIKEDIARLILGTIAKEPLRL